jgi:hypothetical protein
VASYDLLSDAFLLAHPEEAASAIEELELADAAAFLAAGRRRIVRPGARAHGRRARGRVHRFDARRERRIDRPITSTCTRVRRILRSIDASAREPLLAAAEPEISGPLRLLLTYREGTAGALMDHG